MFKYLFKRDTILATVMVFVVMGLLSLIPLNTHVLDPLKLALQDFDYNDMAFARFNKNSNSRLDTNLVIVNIDKANREQIAAMVNKIAATKPKVLGVDIVFEQPKEAASDSLLQSALQNPLVVMAYRLNTSEESVTPQALFYNNVKQKGFANFVGEEGGTIRHFAPFVEFENQTYESFSAAVLQKANAAAYAILKKKHHATEIINYTRQAEKFMVINGNTLLDSNNVQEFSFTNKIVLLGFAPEDGSWEDKHFTPMNAKYVGKSSADMQGVFVHANILEMLLQKNYISKTATWLTWLLAFVLCWLHMAIFIKYFLEHHIWFHLVAKIAQLVSTILFVYLGLLFFVKFDHKLNLAPTLVAIILAVDVLYFYEAIAKWLNQKFGFKNIFSNAKH